MERMLRDKRVLLLFLLPVIIVYSVIVPIPLVVSIVLSLFDWNLLKPPAWVGLRNFINLFTTDFILNKAVVNTLTYLGLSILLQLPMAFLLANLLYFKTKGSNVFRNIIYLPVTFSGVAVSLMWYFIYHPSVGLLNQVIRILGASHFSWAWLNETRTAMYAVVVSVAWQWTGYHMVLYIAGMTSIPQEIVESARIDGASVPQIVRHLVFPYLIPMLSVSTVLITTSSLKSFDSIYVMTQGGPSHATEVLASHMYTKSFAQLKYGYGSSIGVLLFVLCIVSTQIIQRTFRAIEGGGDDGR
jgi:raffinose/stachyose/melibiose transport system permease protein